MNNPRHILLWLMSLLCFVAMSFAGNRNNYFSKDSTLASSLGKWVISGNNHLQLLSGCDVKLPPDNVECNSGVIHFATDPQYTPVYSDNIPGDIYNWMITGYTGSTSVSPIIYKRVVVVGTVGGASPLCIGATSSYTNDGGDAGGVWSSSSPSVATVDPATGMVTAVSAGSSDITYTVNGLSAAKTIIVKPDANAGIISGISPLCKTATPTYTTNGNAGGIWSSASPLVATVDASSGEVTAISTGTSLITYTVSGCGTNLTATKLVTVSPHANPGTIMGATSLCIGTTGLYTTSGDKGGNWSTLMASGITVEPTTGVVTAVNTGTFMLLYTTNSGKCDLSTYYLITVKPNTSAGTVSGTTPLCIGATSTFTASGVAGGVWSSASPTVATVDPVTGVVTAVSAGTSVINYTINGCGPNLNATKEVTVNPQANPGAISGATPICIGTNAAYTTNGDAGGKWSSSLPSVAKVDPVTGIITAISAGTSDITYTVTGCGTNLSVTKPVVVSPVANAGTISGVTSLCIGSASPFTTNGDAGGTWGSTNASIATVDPATGMVTAIKAGTITLNYIVNSCAAPSTKMVIISPDAIAGTISGVSSICIGATSTYTTNGDANGVWSSASTSVATINPVTGKITGISAGTSLITYTVTGCGTNLTATKLVTVNPNANAGTLSGATPVCIGATPVYSTNGEAGGVWTSTLPLVATVNPATGMVTAISAGSSVITYSINGCANPSATEVITVSPNANPGILHGPATLCIGTSGTYTSDGNTGGTWSSASPSVATVDPATGLITAISAGTSLITYTVSGCGTNLSATKLVTVSADAKAGIISGATPVCRGTSTPYTSDGNGGGVWSSASPSIATVNPVTGIVTAVSAGTTTITYTVTGCGTNLIATQSITVSPNANAGSISGATPICIGATSSFTTNGDAGGAWSSSSPLVATIDPLSGIITAISAGTATITYTASGCSSPTATKAITVNPDVNAGIISGATPLCIGSATPYISNGNTGGSWSSASPSVATVNAVTGIVTAISAGTSVITYTISGCGTNLSATKIITINPTANAGILSGITPLCINATASYTTNGDAGGAWSSSSPSVATINSVSGLITAISAGTTTITYTLSGCATPSTKVVTVTPNANAGTISGTTPLCINASASYTTNGNAGGIWSSSSPSVATVNAASGLVTAISAGTADITYTVIGCGTSLSSTKTLIVDPNANAGTISGVSPLCIGASTAYVTDGDAGGTWSSTSPSVATVQSATGIVTAISAGTATITYTLSGCAAPASRIITVSPNANAGIISGATPVCIGATTNYSSTGNAGGAWSSASPLVATVDPATGIVTAISAGTAIISYTVTGCGTNLIATKSVTVSPNANAGTISGATPLCIGASATYTTDGDAGGVWTSSSTSVATVNPATGVVKAKGAGTSIITYTVSGCGPDVITTTSVTVSPNASAGTISGLSPLCIGASSPYTTNGNAGGSWSSNNLSVATVDPLTGIVTAVSAGNAIITYHISIGCAAPSVTKTVTVNPDANAGVLSGPDPLCLGTSGLYTTTGDAGGVWSSASPSVAKVDPVTGLVTAIGAGTSVITYTVSGCGSNLSATIVVTVKPNANAGVLNGLTPLCIGATTTYTTNGDAGGIWSSSSPSVATVAAGTGVVTAISAGTTTITYSIPGTATECADQSSIVLTVKPTANAGVLSGTSPLCIGSSSTYTTNGDAGGIWSSASPSIATVDPSTGMVTAISVGTSLITYTISGCGPNLSATKTVTVSPNANAGTLSGTTPLCIGATTTYTTNGDAGGTWSSASPSVVTVVATTGVVTAVSAGTATITYTVSGCAVPASIVITVKPNANAGTIGGITPVCIGTTTIFSTNGDAGGVWTSASPLIASVDPTTGVITAVTPGTSIITYTISGCGPNLTATKTVTVSPQGNAGTITGITPLCKGATTTYTTDGDAGGIWTSASTTVATVGAATGIITAKNAGTSLITYTITGCGPNLTATKTVAVSPDANAGIISGSNLICKGATTTYTSNGDAGGVWTSASPLVATVDPVTGTITAITSGTSLITYTVTGCGTNLVATKLITVSAAASAGIVSGATPLCIGMTSPYTTNGDPGGAWSSTSPSVATINASTGVVTAISAGTATIAYTVSGCVASATKVVTVNSNANAGIISGSTPLCIGATSTYSSNGDAGGVWTSGSPLVATVEAATGVVTAISAGTAIITYTVNGCAAPVTKVVTVNADAKAGILSGVSPLCIGATSIYTTNGDAGGIWSSASPSIATVDPATGTITAISAGTSIITYTVSGCGTSLISTISTTVSPNANAGILSGITPLCIGATSNYTTNGDAGGVWSSTSPAIATVVAGTGVVSAISAGTTTITYTLSGCASPASTVVIVKPDVHAGTLSGVTPVCIGSTPTYTTTGDAGGIWSSSSPLVATIDPVTGKVTAISAGTTAITYTLSGCGTNLTASKLLTVSPDGNPGTISGVTPLCIGATTTYTTNGDAGGVWTSTLPLVATVDPVTGLVSAISAGTSLVTYSVGGCSIAGATKTVTVSPQANAGAIIGPSPLCIGATPTYFSSGDAGGVWSSATISVATVDAATGMITAVGAGTSVITYQVNGCTSPIATKMVTVKLNANAGTLTGITPLCIGSTTTYTTNGDAGGEWSSASPLIATVDPLSGVVTAVSAGKAIITYTTTTGCGPVAKAIKEITVSPDANAGILNGNTPLCIGTTGLYTTSGDAGGVWSSASPSIATINPSTGLIKAIRSGTSDITYTVTGCGTNLSATKPVVVNPDAYAGIVSGVTPLCIGTSRSYTSDGDAGGIWTSSSPLIATVDPQTGMVTAISAGVSTITYTVSGCAAPATKVVTVSPEANPGNLSGATALCIGTSALYTTDGDKGGAWSTFMSSGITVDPVTGKVTAVNTGTFMILYTAKGGQCDLSAYYLITVNPGGNAGVVSGKTPLCIGATSTYTSDGDEGGAWSSSSPSVATVNPSTGIVTALSAGITTITYTASGCFTPKATKVLTVSPNANAGILSGATPLCIGVSTTYTSNGDTGGTWSSTSPSVATVDPLTGVVTAIATGTTTITYTVTGCGTNLIATKELIVSTNANAGIVSGATPLCIGVTTTYTTNGDAGGAWSSSSPFIATIDPVTGIVTTISAGTSIITYTANGCSSPTATKIITVNPNVNAGIITGTTPVCIGTTTTYATSGIAGGTWNSTSPSVATIDPLTGVITAISAGTTTITYTVSGCSVPAAKILLVSPAAHAGIISGATAVCVNVTTPYTTNGDGGGAWSSASPSIATVDPVTGLVTAVSAGTSSITYAVNTANNCNASVTKPILVNGLPVASFSSSLAQICENSSLFIDSNLIKLNKDSNTSQYQWYINNSLLGTASYFPGYTIDKKDDLVTIKLIAISLFGCNSDTLSKSITVIHSPKPSFSVSDTIGCGPLAVSFNNTTIGTAYQYHWNFGNGSTSNASQPASVTYDYTGSGPDTTYTISLTAYSTCDTVTISKNIVVKRKAKADFSATPTIGCSPIKVLFTNNSIDKNTTYQLWFGDGTDTLLTTASISHNYYTGVSTIYNAKLVAINACGSDSVSIPITGSPNTIRPAIFAKDSIRCGSPNTVTMYNTTTGANQFNWDFGDGVTSTSLKSPDSVSHVYTQNGNYVVKIRISNGCSDTVIVRNISIYSIPKVDFTAVPQSVCMGDSIHFNALTDLGNSVLWHFGDGSGSVLNNPVYSYKNAGIYSVVLKVANANNTCYDSITKPIEIVASLHGYMQASDTVVKCVPFTVTFTNHSTPSINTQWNFGDGSSAKGDIVTHTFTSNGDYQVTMLSQSPGGCKFADTNNIRVASPGGSLVYTTNLSCTKGPIKFESITTNADSIRWDFGDGTTLTAGAGMPVYHTYPQAGIYLPKARIIGSAGCSVLKDLGDTIKIEQVVAAYKLAVVYECGKTTFNFIDSSHSFFGISNWNWNIGPASFSNQKNITQVYTQAGVYPVSLIVTGNTGCKDTVKSNMQVAIYQYPKVNIDGVAAVCKESLINLKSQVVSSDSIKSIIWDLGNGLTSKDSIVQVVYNSSGSYLVKLTVSTINKCYDSAYKQLTIYSAPSISLNKTNTVCRGSAITIQASGALNYIWKDQNDSIVCNGCSSINVTPLNNVQYQVIGYNQYGCSKVDSAAVNVIQPFLMTVSPDDSICKGSEKKLSANGANSYSWYPENTLNNCTSATVYASPLVTTTYQVIGKDRNKCFADTSHVTVVVGDPTPLDIGRDTIMQSGTTYTFNPVLPSGDIIKWNWSGIPNSSCNNCPNPQAKVVYDVCVSCTVTNSYNCLTSDTLCIKTFCPDAVVFVPNAFTPDGDGINDKLMIQGKGIKQIKSYRIFNRWGEMVFERTNFSPGDPAYAWDGKIRGKLATPDIFVYIIEGICEKGYSSIFKGNVAILK